MSAPASQRIIDLLGFLRSTGSELPASNSECAGLLRDGLLMLSEFDDQRLSASRDQLCDDFDVIIEEIQFREERDAEHAAMHASEREPRYDTDPERSRLIGEIENAEDREAERDAYRDLAAYDSKASPQGDYDQAAGRALRTPKTPLIQQVCDQQGIPYTDLPLAPRGDTLGEVLLEVQQRAEASKPTIRDEAAAYVGKHGRWLREGVYCVRWPQYSGEGLILAKDTGELTDKLAERMQKVVPVGTAVRSCDLHINHELDPKYHE